MENRIIKFRAWFPGPNVMGLVTNLKGSNDGYQFNGIVAECFIDGRQVFYEAYQNFTLMQFTGKLDADKKEIYDLDILRVTDEGEFGDINHYFIVTWIHEWSMFAAIDHTEYNGYLAKGIEAIDETMFWTYNLEESEQFTICGNIIEHPDYIMNACKGEEDTMHDVIGDLPD